MLIRPRRFALTFAAILLAVSAHPDAQYTAMHASPDAILEGHWQSCYDDSEGSYIERVFTHRHPSFEVHLGPRDEFAVFIGEAARERAHDGPLNLLRPSFRVGDVFTKAAGRNWRFVIDGQAYWLNVENAGGSRDNCLTGSEYPRYSYRILLKRDS